MALPPGAIPSPHEPFTNDKGVVTRTWYRVIAALTGMSGQLAQPIVVKPNSFFVSGDVNSGGTLEPASIPPGTLLGNPAGTAAAATPLAIDSSLSMADGSLGIAPIEATTLLGNPDATSAQPSPIGIGSGLTLVPGTPPQLTANGGGGSAALLPAQLLSWWRG